MTITVYSPEVDFNGEVGGVAFHKGKAEVEASQVRALAYFRRKGYRIDDAPAAEPDATAPAVSAPEPVPDPEPAPEPDPEPLEAKKPRGKAKKD